MKDLIMKIILIGFVIFIGYTFIYGVDGSNTLQNAANKILTKANSTLAAVDITKVDAEEVANK